MTHTQTCNGCGGRGEVLKSAEGEPVWKCPEYTLMFWRECTACDGVGTVYMRNGRPGAKIPMDTQPKPNALRILNLGETTIVSLEGHERFEDVQ